MGLADSTIGGDDTGDAGNPQLFHSLRDNARSLAAGYWLNDTLYHREVCDMSVRMPADVEEVRLRLALMTLAGCSISFSDELQHMPPSRIRMMQQCLPPGTPPMRPLDLFQRTVPSIWKIHCKTKSEEWDIYGLFNFEDAPQERAIELPDADQAIFEFWEAKFLGAHRRRFVTLLAPHTSRVISVRPLTGKPQIIGTNMHLLQGYHELSNVRWDDASHTLGGIARRAAGMDGTVFVHVPQGFSPHFDFPLTAASAHLTHIDGPTWAHEIQFDRPDKQWSIPFDTASDSKK